MQRYFVGNDNYKNNIINKEDSFHIKKVIRANIGNSIIVCNDDGVCSLSKITSLDECVTFDKEKELESTELDIKVTIAQCLPKGDKFDYIVQKATELGVSNIIPVESKRSIVKYDSKKKEKKVTRWQKISKEASEQSHRNKVPLISNFVDIKNIELNYDLLVICYEEENSNLINFKTAIKKDISSALFLIGPEGGLDESEVSSLLEKGFIKCGLGKRILRTETASSFVLSSLIYEKELKL